jgi:hypothetical protein
MRLRRPLRAPRRLGAALALAACALWARPAESGLGTVVAGTWNPTVYFGYETADGEFDEWKPVLIEFSRLLYDATEKQLRLGTVTLTDSTSLRRRADIYVRLGTGGASAALRGINASSQYINISQVHKCTGGPQDDPAVCVAGTRGHFGLLHEAGHYLFGTLDEYRGCTRFPGSPDCVRDQSNNTDYFCAISDGVKGCVMDGGSTIGGNNLRTEYCIDGGIDFAVRHLPTYYDRAGRLVTNSQHRENGGACWSTIATSEVPLLPPPGVPVSDTTGFLPPTFVEVVGEQGLVLAVDTSSSMNQVDPGATGSRLDLARVGAINAVDLMEDDEVIGLVSFNTSSQVDLSPRQATTGARLDAADAIQGLVANGWTDMGGGLRTAFEALDATGPEAVAGKGVILISDGFDTVGEPPDDVLPDVLASNRVEVHTIAVGPQADVETLQRLAARTGGVFFAVDSAQHLPTVLPKVVAAARGEVVTAEVAGTVGAGGMASFTVEVDSYATRSTFLLSHVPNAPLDLELTSPSGVVFDHVGTSPCFEPPGGPRDCSNDIRLAINPAQRFYRLPASLVEEGTWQVRVLNNRGGGGSDDFVFLLTGEAPGVVAGAEIEGADAPIVYPAPVVVRVAVVGRTPVGGADVTALVRQPGGRVEEIVLHDDGLPEHGDALADDGIYSGRFTRFASATDGGGDGIYVFEITAENAAGYEVRPSEDTPTAPADALPWFVARTETCARVTGIPALIEPGVVALQAEAPGPLDLPATALDSTPVLAFTLTAAGEEVFFDGLTVRSSGSGNEASITEIALHDDADGDGRADNPARPLARGRFAGDDGAVTFAPGSAMAILPADTPRRFLVTFGPPQAPALDDLLAQMPAGSGAPPPVPVLPPLVWLLAATALVGALAWRRMGRRAPRPVAVLGSVLFALLLVGAVGCGPNDSLPRAPGTPPGGPEAPAGPGSYRPTFDRSDIELRGATSGATLSPAGAGVSGEIVLR